MSPSPTAMPRSLEPEFPVLIVASRADEDSPIARSVVEIIEALEASGRPVVVAHSLDDAEAAIGAHPGLCCVVLGWGLASQSDAALDQTARILQILHDRSPALPVLLGASRQATHQVPLEIVEQVEGYIWVPEDSAAFIAGRIDAASRRYLDTVLPPFFGALANFAATHEYSWHTPGHTGGTAFMKTAVGRAFMRFYGEQMLRSDLSISVGELGSLNDHSGPVDQAERYAARVFGADHTFFVIGGSSASNQIILRSSVADGDVALVDRNCHKSLNYALNVSGAVPVYLKPRRNPRGVIGPVPSSELEPEVIRQKLEESPLVGDAGRKPVIAALTNSTYDGLCYDVETTTRLLSDSVDRIHYDEAWYAYARFNPLCGGRYGMHRGSRSPDDATVTATHSTHKLLAAQSQASMIHIRPGAGAGRAGALQRVVHDVHVDVSAVQRWWFQPWQPDLVNGKDFLDVDTDTLAPLERRVAARARRRLARLRRPRRALLHARPEVTTLTPGVGRDGKLEERGIPAAIVTAYLDTQGIVVEKTEPYSILTLFSIGITKGKWGSLVAGFMGFKELYDANAPLESALPELVRSYPGRYGRLGLRDLADEMHAAIGEHDILGNLDAAFSNLPEPVLSPRETFARLVRREVERVPASELEGRTLAVQVVPYPPGIPVLMPGERFGEATRAVGDYLLGLEAFDRRFPGFEHDTHGVEVETDETGCRYALYCLTR